MVQNKRLLVVEDHQDIAEMIVDYMTSKGHSVDYAADGVTGLHLAVSQEFEVIVLDLSLPGLNGIELCKQLRTVARKSTPVIMLTARDSLDDKILGFDVGADDYLVKPFAMRELEVRVHALSRRLQPNESELILRCGDVLFDLQQMTVTRDNERIGLTPTGYQILASLMRASPAYVRREELERELWGEDRPDSDALRSHIYALRKSLDRPYTDKLIQHSTAGGYRIVDSTT
ncbi:MAG: response regulator transcription factor [Pseudomonadales bacterium]|jgi:DNA-binding response OmpR family regulator